MNQNEVYSLQDLVSRATELDFKSTFVFSTNYSVWNQGEKYGPNGSHTTHYANYQKTIANNHILYNIQRALRENSTLYTLQTFKNTLDKYTPLCSDLCQLITKYYYEEDVNIEDCIIQWTKINFSKPLVSMYMGMEHNAGGMMCMYSLETHPIQTIDLTNVPKMLYWCKAPEEYGLHASLDFRDENKYVYAPVICSVEYKLYYVPNGRECKKLPHLVSGFHAKQNDKLELIHCKEELCYDPRIPMYTSVLRDLYKDGYIPRCIEATSEYKQKVNELVPGYYDV